MDMIYADLAAFRSDPRQFFPSCAVPDNLQPLFLSTALEESARFQATHQTSNPSHQTAPDYCHLFGDCSYASRIRHFAGEGSSYQLEVLIKGPRKNQIRKLASSHGHCAVMSNRDITHFGGHLIGNLLIITFARIPEELRAM